MQLDALRKAGCEMLFEDNASGVKTDRPGLAEAIRYVRDGDTLTIWKLGRLGRSMKHLIDIITELEAKGVGFRSITENIDTATSGGRLVFHLFGALAQFERDLIREITRAGLQAAEERPAWWSPSGRDIGEARKGRRHLAAGSECPRGCRSREDRQDRTLRSAQSREISRLYCQTSIIPRPLSKVGQNARMRERNSIKPT
ncbi:recombinase family protein [Mesorhizobium delmotii]|uniref:recombinase family protein n=1 Tax=Mesorhizobium delmotii TaxID=1631247 RepID=UPI003CC7D909